jgi:hypothetical protein
MASDKDLVDHYRKRALLQAAAMVCDRRLADRYVIAFESHDYLDGVSDEWCRENLEGHYHNSIWPRMILVANDTDATLVLLTFDGTILISTPETLLA